MASHSCKPGPTGHRRPPPGAWPRLSRQPPAGSSPAAARIQTSGLSMRGRASAAFSNLCIHHGFPGRPVFRPKPASPPPCRRPHLELPPPSCWLVKRELSVCEAFSITRVRVSLSFLWIPCELIPGFTHNYPLSFHVYQCGHPQLGWVPSVGILKTTRKMSLSSRGLESAGETKLLNNRTPNMRASGFTWRRLNPLEHKTGSQESCGLGTLLPRRAWPSSPTEVDIGVR